MMRSRRIVLKTQPEPMITVEDLHHAKQDIMEHLECADDLLRLFLIDSEFVGFVDHIWQAADETYVHEALATESREVWLLSGCSMPVILEKQRSWEGTDQTTHKVVSHAVVDVIDIHGQRCNVMNGEAWRTAKPEDFEWVKIIKCVHEPNLSTDHF